MHFLNPYVMHILPPQFQPGPRSLTSPARATESLAAPGHHSPLLKPPGIAAV